MIRSLAVLWAALTMALSGICCAGISNASPADDSGTGQCTFILPAPKVVQVSGVNFVTATMHPGPCTLKASPNFSEVCLSVEGDDSAGQCATQTGQDPAVLYYPYRPGATYVVKGQGCTNNFTPPYTTCQDFLASRVTL